jgi:hypothetical protein
LSGVGEPNHFTAAKCTVSIDDQIIEVDSGPFNIRQIFGDEAILVDSSGQLVLTDEWGVTLDSLQHGASYFLVCIYYLIVTTLLITFSYTKNISVN